jgi:NAD+ synthase
MKSLVQGTVEYNLVKNEILTNYGVTPTGSFNVKEAVRNRINYLKNFLKETGRKAYILGISGGVDSSATGRLCQLACEELRVEGYPATFVAMRLPAGVQRDESDAQESIKFINADKTLTVNVGEAATNLSIQGVEEFQKAGNEISSLQVDFNKGNIKARLRMVAQYQAAAMYEGLVIGTDHNAECVMGFFTLFGDGACDLTVLGGLSKRQVRLVAKELGSPEFLWSKAPTADLEELNPGKLDDEGFGFKYDYIDEFLEGNEIPKEVENRIVNHFNNTRFKRNAIPGFSE